jgi:hypothetical protein
MDMFAISNQFTAKWRTSPPFSGELASRHSHLTVSPTDSVKGHSTKKMIDEVCGAYRKGLIEGRQLSERGFPGLRTVVPLRYRQRMALLSG